MLTIYERTDTGTMILVAISKDKMYRELFEKVRGYTPKRENPYYELFRDSTLGRTFICSGYANNHADSLNELIRKFYERRH